MEPVSPIEDIEIELHSIMKTPTMLDDEHMLTTDQVLIMMLIARLDSIDKTLSDLVYKREK